MRNNPNCVVAVIGYGLSSKAAQQMSWERVNAIINYLTEKEGISGGRLSSDMVSRWRRNTVDLQDGTGQEGPNTVPAPHPGLEKKRINNYSVIKRYQDPPIQSEGFLY